MAEVNLTCLATNQDDTLEIRINRGKGNEAPKNKVEAQLLWDTFMSKVGGGFFDEFLIIAKNYLTKETIARLERMEESQMKSFQRQILKEELSSIRVHGNADYRELISKLNDLLAQNKGSY